MAAAKKRARKSAAATGGNDWRKSTGQRAVGLTLPEADYKRAQHAAVEVGVSLAEFCRRACLERAEKILEKSAEST